MMWLTLLSLALGGDNDGYPPPMPWPGDPEPGPPHPPTGNSMGKTCAGYSRPVSRPVRPADPEKKRARKAQKKARRAGK
jgi:hypothetical protein